MRKRFEPHRRLLRILVGSNLYDSSSACIRELIQNAWDAIQLRKYEDGTSGTIQVRYSQKESWFEVEDNGIGMDDTTVEDSFLQVGQDKLEVMQMGSRDSQVGYFGIGILSAFLVASKIEVATKFARENSEGLHFEIRDIDENYVVLPDPPDKPGTRVRIHVKPGILDLAEIPHLVETHAPHIEEVNVFSMDSGSQVPLTERWVTDDLNTPVRPLTGIPGVLDGRMGLNPALLRQEGALTSQMTICNSGFRAENDVIDLVPTPYIGVIAEVNLAPNELTMGMSRERIQRDEKWRELGLRLQTSFADLIARELSVGEFREGSNYDDEELRRALLIWYYHLPNDGPFRELCALIQERLLSSVRFRVADRGESTLASLVQKVSGIRRMFFREVGRSQRRETIDDEGLPIQILQEIHDSVRVGALRANGFDVVELKDIQVNVRNERGVQVIRIPESNLVNKCVASRGIQLVNIANAAEEDMDLRGIERLSVLRDALTADHRVRFADLPDSKRRMIIDSGGERYMNVQNEEARRVVEAIPEAISNPLKERLLDIYLKVDSFQLADARRILTELLGSKRLAEMASGTSAPFTRRYVEREIDQMIRGTE